MTHLSTAPQRRRFRALDALDRLVAHECEAVTVVSRSPARDPAAAEAPTDADTGGDEAFIQGAIAYLSTRPNAAALIAGIDSGWKELQAGRDESPPSPDVPPDAAPQSAPESAPEPAP